MADILIRGMEMPESCFECVTTNSFFRNLHCDKLEGMSGFVGSLPHKNDRHPNCPLVPLPEKYGRLIDADALYERAASLDAQALDYVAKLIERDGDEISTEWKIWSAILAERTAFKHDVFDAPTIIPAEGGENE